MTAIMGGISSEIDSITAQIETLNSEISGVSSGDGPNMTVGRDQDNTGAAAEDRVGAIVKQMYQNAQAWHTADEERRLKLDEENMRLGELLKELGIPVVRKDGVWYVGNEKLFDKYRNYIYHTGGFVGDEPLKPNEQYIKAENGELVMTASQQDSLAEQIDRIGATADYLATMHWGPTIPTEIVKGLRNPVSAITNNDPHSIEINFGGTIINGIVGQDAAEKHVRIDRKMVNEIARLLRIK